MRIRLLKRSDIAGVSGIVEQNYSKKWGKQARGELRDMFGTAAIKPAYIVAEEGGELVGFAGYAESRMDYGVYEIFWVNVSPEKQRQGIGRELMVHIIRTVKEKKGARSILLAVDTEMNKRYYEKNFGFKTVQTFNGGEGCILLLVL